MPKQLSDCIGDWFEGIIKVQLPGLKKIRDKNNIRPDFSCSHFDAEAKAGYWEYGVQLKEFQIEGFVPNGKPVVYFIGYHSTEGLLESTQNMTQEEIEALLRDNAEMHSTYVVSNDIVAKMWKKEHYVAQSSSRTYFSVRPRHLDAIIHNRPFERSGVRHMPSRWYGISRSNFLLLPAPSLAGNKNTLKFGAILDKQADRAVVEYMEARSLF